MSYPPAPNHPAILIEREGSAARVTIQDPPSAAWGDAAFALATQAERYALLLAATEGWPIMELHY